MTPFFSSRWVEVPEWVREDPAGGLPARSALGVSALALPGALLEIECQAYAGKRE